MRPLRYFEDFAAAVGQSVDLGSVAFSADDIIAFATRYDPQPMHVDPERARESIYGGLIASGWHTGASYMRLLVDRIMADSESVGSPGIEQLRWLKPVRPGDSLRGRFTILETRLSNSRPEWGIVRSRGELLDQADEPVMQLEAINFFKRRP